MEGRANRKYSDEAAVAAAVTNAGYEPYEPKLLTITAMTNMLATDLSVFCGQLAEVGEQFIIDEGNGDNGANGRARDGLPYKFGLTYVLMFQPFQKVGVFFLRHARLDYMTSVRCVVLLRHSRSSPYYYGQTERNFQTGKRKTDRLFGLSVKKCEKDFVTFL